ncbi:MAG: hypothetical protein M1812_004725 [Candelaria pacifica]|nr:MAG: hypothetical protein M1812_004725 [Candelaria pacifica]
MPPQRTIPAAKAVKTERTHEENQERAYIAASRRSDRSLEARVESARRASEIHKRRTGRSLRVTEQDVVNEEMYEEEDDDLPFQYRRLTAHLQTGSADFNRRLTAYLTNHVAMRSALDQAINDSYAQQYPNAPQFAHNQPMSIYPSPMMEQPIQRQSPAAYRQSPYPIPSMAGQRPGVHARSHSIATAQEHPSHSGGGSLAHLSPDQVDHRRTSMPATVDSTANYNSNQQMRPTSSNNPNSRPSQSPTANGADAQQRKLKSSPEIYHPSSMPPPVDNNNAFNTFGPLTTSLPTESQMFLSSPFDHNNAFASMFAPHNDYTSQPYYHFDPNASTTSKPRNSYPSVNGMSTTLAPSVLDLPADPLDFNDPLSASTASVPTPTFHYNPDGALNDSFKGQLLTRSNSTQGSQGGLTPGGDGEWASFIDVGSWDDGCSC